MGVVASTGYVSRSYAGPAAMLQIEIAANSSASITLDTYQTYIYDSDQLQYCAVGGSTGIEIECDTLDTMPNSSLQVAVINNPTGSTVTRMVYFETLTPSYFRIDNFTYNEGATLRAGHYEDVHISSVGPIVEHGTSWATVSSYYFSNKGVRQATTPGDYIQFQFEGTGFDIGTLMGRNGSEMLICYLPTSASFDGTWNGDNGETCLEYQNETAYTNYDVMRSVVGLPFDTYRVGVVHMDDGTSEIYGSTRSPSYPARLAIDYVDIFNGPTLDPITEPGTYNEDANGGGDAYLQLFPQDRWTQVTGIYARYASNQSYYSVSANNRILSTNAGAAAAMKLHLENGQGATVILDTYASGYGHSTDGLQACIYKGATLVDCQVITTLTSSKNQVVQVPTNTGAADDFTIVFQMLSRGYFRIDGYQVILGTTLTEGIYDNQFMSDGGLIDLDGTWSLPPAYGTKYYGTYGNEVILSKEVDASASFDFYGTGIDVITVEDIYRIPVEICIEKLTTYTSDGFTSDDCEIRGPQVSAGRYTQYGLTVYGLAPDTYHARIRLAGPLLNAYYSTFRLDAIAIFGDITAGAPLAPGLYDDTQLVNNDAVEFGPGPFWAANTRYYYGPPYGPWQKTEQQAYNAGSVLQVYVAGNTLTLYQNVGYNSPDIRVCLVIPGMTVNELQCNNFSQYGLRKYFSPISIFGLGAGNHQMIFENRSPRRRFNVDAMQVTP